MYVEGEPRRNADYPRGGLTLCLCWGRGPSSDGVTPSRGSWTRDWEARIPIRPNARPRPRRGSQPRRLELPVAEADCAVL
mgnify:CR=1 FL=1